jgi:hypothetical protein
VIFACVVELEDDVETEVFSVVLVVVGVMTEESFVFVDNVDAVVGVEVGVEAREIKQEHADEIRA